MHCVRGQQELYSLHNPAKTDADFLPKIVFTIPTDFDNSRPSMVCRLLASDGGLSYTDCISPQGREREGVRR